MQVPVRLTGSLHLTFSLGGKAEEICRSQSSKQAERDCTGAWLWRLAIDRNCVSCRF